MPWPQSLFAFLFVFLSLAPLSLSAQTSGDYCLASDTVNNMMYVNPCSATTVQSPPPSDSGGLNWLSPGYNLSSVGGWTTPALISPLGLGWYALCPPDGATGINWIGYDTNGDNPCGTSTDLVANEYFINTFTIPAGCAVTQAQLVLNCDNVCDRLAERDAIGSGGNPGFPV